MTIILKSGATLSTTGGTDSTFTRNGINPDFKDLSIIDERLRPSMTVTNKVSVASAQAPDGYTQSRTSLIIRVPKTLANSKITINTIRLEIAYDPQTTDAERENLLEYACQAGIVTALKDAFKYGILPS